jgi:hypothetical protein
VTIFIKQESNFVHEIKLFPLDVLLPFVAFSTRLPGAK